MEEFSLSVVSAFEVDDNKFKSQYFWKTKILVYLNGEHFEIHA